MSYECPDATFVVESRKRSKRGVVYDRNIFPKSRYGTASCAYLHPYSVTMLNPDGSEIAPARRGEFFDPWANDQDFALYYILRAEDETDLSLKGKQ